MSSESASSLQPMRPRRLLPSWFQAKALWAGLSIITMWLAVLFVGVFGGNFVSTSSSGSTTFPVVVFLLPFVLPATISVGRRGFRDAMSRVLRRTTKRRRVRSQRRSLLSFGRSSRNGCYLVSGPLRDAAESKIIGSRFDLEPTLLIAINSGTPTTSSLRCRL
jgi:hypothetical protein